MQELQGMFITWWGCDLLVVGGTLEMLNTFPLQLISPLRTALAMKSCFCLTALFRWKYYSWTTLLSK